jgi:hypothetical protein
MMKSDVEEDWGRGGQACRRGLQQGVAVVAAAKGPAGGVGRMRMMTSCCRQIDTGEISGRKGARKLQGITERNIKMCI